MNGGTMKKPTLAEAVHLLELFIRFVNPCHQKDCPSEGCRTAQKAKAFIRRARRVK